MLFWGFSLNIVQTQMPVCCPSLTAILYNSDLGWETPLCSGLFWQASIQISLLQWDWQRPLVRTERFPERSCKYWMWVWMTDLLLPILNLDIDLCLRCENGETCGYPLFFQDDHIESRSLQRADCEGPDASSLLEASHRWSEALLKREDFDLARRKSWNLFAQLIRISSREIQISRWNFPTPMRFMCIAHADLSSVIDRLPFSDSDFEGRFANVISTPSWSSDKPLSFRRILGDHGCDPFCF